MENLETELSKNGYDIKFQEDEDSYQEKSYYCEIAKNSKLIIDFNQSDEIEKYTIFSFTINNILETETDAKSYIDVTLFSIIANYFSIIECSIKELNEFLDAKEEEYPFGDSVIGNYKRSNNAVTEKYKSLNFWMTNRLYYKLYSMIENLPFLEENFYISGKCKYDTLTGY